MKKITPHDLLERANLDRVLNHLNGLDISMESVKVKLTFKVRKGEKVEEIEYEKEIKIRGE